MVVALKVGTPGVGPGTVRRLAMLIALACLAAPAAAQAAPTLGGWDARVQRAVARAGLLAPLTGGFCVWGGETDGPSYVTHEGIALSPTSMIHASSPGVYVSSLLERWRRAEFSWARRVL